MTPDRQPATAACNCDASGDPPTGHRPWCGTEPATAATLTPERAAIAGLVPQEWSPGGNRCQKSTNGRTGRCHNRARWCDTAAGERYDRYHQTWTREPGSYAYKVCNRHALAMVGEVEHAR